MKKLITLFLCIMLTVSIAGCASYTKHSKKFNDAVGKWSLNCIYVDTKPILFNPQILEIKRNKDAILTETVTVTPAKVNPDGTTVPAETKDETYNLTITAKTGEMTIKKDDGSSVTYTFSVDKPASLLHMYTTIDNQTYHYIYLEVK